MDLSLDGRVAIVTGGAKGIGAATIRALAREGATAVCVDRDGVAAERLMASLDRSAMSKTIVADLSDVESCRRAVAETHAGFGRLDALVNNAGHNDGVGLDADPASFMASVRANLEHVYAMTHFAAPHLRESAGAVVNLGSKVSVTGQGATSGYAAAKGAIAALTREWSLAFASDGVRVNCVLPSECMTDQYEQWLASLPDPAATRRSIESLVPLGRRMTTAEEIADAITFLVSPRSSHTTGQLLFVDGGYAHLDRAASHPHHKWG